MYVGTYKIRNNHTQVYIYKFNRTVQLQGWKIFETPPIYKYVFFFTLSLLIWHLAGCSKGGNSTLYYSAPFACISLSLLPFFLNYGYSSEKKEREREKIETLSLHWLTRVMGNSVSETQEVRREESSGLVGVDCPPSPPTGSSQQPYRQQKPSQLAVTSPTAHAEGIDQVEAAHYFLKYNQGREAINFERKWLALGIRRRDTRSAFFAARKTVHH